MDKAIILSRVSTLAQHLESQTNDLFNDAKQRGYSKDNLIVIEDKESAIKLSEVERNGLNTMKYHIETGEVDCVFVWEITRISRQLPMLYSIRDYLQQHHVQLYCHQPQFTLFNDDWSISDVSNMVFAMFAVLAENEMKTKKARMLRSRKNNVAQGKSGGGRCPFGYTTNKENYYILHEEQAPIVRRIFEDYSTGMKSMRTIAKELHAEGLFPNTKYLTLLCDINNWVKQEYYCGKAQYPAIITQELFDKCTQARKHNITVKHGHKTNVHLLKGLIYDKDNGLLLSVNRANDMYFSKRYKGCSIHRINIDPIVWEVASDIYYNKLNDFDTVYNNLTEKMNTILTKMRVSLEKAESIQEKIDKVEERLIYGKISEDKANSIIDELDKSRKVYKAEYNNYLAESVLLQSQIKELMFGDKTIQGSESFEQKIEIVNKTISKVIISKPTRQLANIEIHNKINNTVLVYQCSCWHHTFKLIHTTTD